VTLIVTYHDINVDTGIDIDIGIGIEKPQSTKMGMGQLIYKVLCTKY
jgi:hypothetical protein